MYYNLLKPRTQSVRFWHLACLLLVVLAALLAWLSFGGGVDAVDVTPPTITVSPSAAHPTPKRTITITWTSADGDLDSTGLRWNYKILNSGTTCTKAEMTTGATATGSTSLVLDSESDNNKKVCVSIKDTSNNVGVGVSGLISGLDRTNPGLTVTPSSDDSTAKQKILISALANDGGSGIDTDSWRLKIIDDGNSCDATEMESGAIDAKSVTLKSESQNNKKVCFSVEDNAGNIVYDDSGTITGIDTTEPTISVTPSSDDSSAKREITISATVSDNGSGIKETKYKVIDGSTTCNGSALSGVTTVGSSITLNEADNGKKVCFSVEDNVAHIVYAASGVITGIDTTAPTISMVRAAAGVFGAGDAIDIDLFLSEAFQTSGLFAFISLSLNSGGSASYVEPISWTHGMHFRYIVTAGENTASLNVTGLVFNTDLVINNGVTITDAVGNPLDTSLPVSDNIADYLATNGETIVIDTTQPTISLTYDGTNLVHADLNDNLDTSPTIEHKLVTDTGCDDTTTGLSSYLPTTAVFLAAGETACFKATDTAGNEAYSLSTVGLDLIAPTITISTDVGYSGAKQEITVSASSAADDLGANPTWTHQVVNDEVDCDADALTSPSTGLSITLNTEAENNHKVCFSVSDTNSNPGYAASGVITGIDRTAPTITVTPSSDDSSPKTAITVSALSDDTDVDSSSWRHKVIVHNADCNATQMTGGSSSGNSVTLNSESDNGKKVCFRVEDNLAHVTYAASGVITGIDRTAPTITSISGDKIDQAYAQGAVIEIIVLLSEALTDLTEPSQLTLSLNSGGTAIYQGSSSSASTPGRNRQLSFNYTVAAGDNTDDLDVTAFNLNQDTVTDRAGNSLDTTLPTTTNLANSSQAIIDTTDPMIDISSLVNNQVSATVTETNLNSFEVQLPTIGSCNSSATGSFTDYNPGETLTLAESQTVCFKATDTAGNEAYSLSTVGLDLIAPTITISTDVGYSGAKQEITVSALSDDTDVDSSSWRHKVIAHDADCNATQMSSSYFIGPSETLNTEAENNHKVCFSVSDTSNNPGYAASGVITGIDRTAPTITVTPDSDDSSPKTTITVSASSTDTNLGSNPAWTYKLIAHDADCNTAQMTGGSSSGNSVTLNTEAENNHKVCFSVSDTNSNPGYAASGVITGIDRTAPTIDVDSNVGYSVAKQEITITASSADIDLPATPVWTYQLIDGATVCNVSTLTNATSGNSITLSSENDNGKKVCFSVTDRAANTAHQASGVITKIDITPPQIVTITGDNIDGVYRQGVALAIIVHLSEAFQVPGSTTNLKLNLNSGGQADYDSHDVNQLTITFVYTVGAGDGHQAIDLNVLELLYTGGTRISDLAGNPLVNTLPVTDNLADNSHVRIDTVRPVITVVDGEANQVSATVTDNHDPSPSLFYQILSAGTCSDTTPGSFTIYTISLTLANETQQACFKASDAAGNLRYQASNMGDDLTAPTVEVKPGSPSQAPKLHLSLTATSADSDVDDTSWRYQLIADGVACDDTTMANPAGVGKTALLESESDNNHQVCFSVKDTNNNIGYGLSGLISGLDRTPPTITLDYDHDLAAPKLAITITAGSTDSDLNSNTWRHKLIDASHDCDGDQLLLGTDPSPSQTLDNQADNNKRVCFSVADNLGNQAYLASAVISGIDRTSPTIRVNPLTADNQVSATVTDNLSDLTEITVSFQIIAAGLCDDHLTGSFSDYPADSLLAISHRQKACFKATDQAGNIGYAASTTGSDITAPLVTVTAGTLVNSFSATDDEPAETTWFLSFIGLSAVCSSGVSFPVSSNYSEGDDISYSDADNRQRICFRSVDANSNSGYGTSTEINIPIVRGTVAPLASSGANTDPVAPNTVALSQDRVRAEATSQTGDSGSTSTRTTGRISNLGGGISDLWLVVVGLIVAVSGTVFITASAPRK